MRVEDHDLLPRLGIDAQLAAPGDRVARGAREPLGFVEPLRLARRDHEQRVRHRRADPEEGFEHRILFALERARGDDHRAIGAHAEVAEHAVAAAIGRAESAVGRAVRVGELERVELQRAGDRHALARGAEVDDAARRLVALHAEPIDVLQDAAEERADEPVARDTTGPRCGR